MYCLPSEDQQNDASPYRCCSTTVTLHDRDTALKYVVLVRIVIVTVQLALRDKSVHSACGVEVMNSDESVHERKAVKLALLGPE